MLSERFGYAHFDTDDYYWVKTDEPYTVARSVDERLVMLERDFKSRDEWVSSGSLSEWGDPLIPYFDLFVYVYVPAEIRVERLRKRERERFGDAVMPGGRRYDASVEFLEWAAGYDGGLLAGRSLPRHEKWIAMLAGMGITVHRIINMDINESMDTVLALVNPTDCGAGPR